MVFDDTVSGGKLIFLIPFDKNAFMIWKNIKLTKK